MSIARNTFYNLAGAMVPTVTALVTVPLYLQRIGEARYGVLAIVWLLLGYFGLFDLGLSRATANKIARLHQAPAGEREEVFWTACLLNAALGVVGGAILYLVGGPIFERWFQMSGPLRAEVAAALPWIAVAVPVATVTGVLTGALEGRQHFRTVNAIQAFGTVLFQAVPLAAAFLVGPELQVIVPVAVAARVVSAFPLALATKAALPLSGSPRIRSGRVRELFAYGAWVTVTNVVGPILSTFDRFLIGIVLGAQAVAYYAVPFDLVNRAQIVPGALSRTLFPHLSAVGAAQSKRVALESVLVLAAITTPMIVSGLLVVRPFLQVWIGAKFAGYAAPVGEVLLLGVWINGLAFVPFALLQARRRPDVVAKFHLLELLPYAVILWYGLHRFGIVGAAVAWALRVGVDAVLLFRAAQLRAEVVKPLIPGAVLVVATWLCVHFSLRPLGTARVYAGLSLLALTAGWALWATPHIRGRMLRVVHNLRVL